MAPRAPRIVVGARYYDPASGRFLQRDPIGIDGGMNVYDYVRSAPVARLDPQGTSWGVAGTFVKVFPKLAPYGKYLGPIGQCIAVIHYGLKAGNALHSFASNPTVGGGVGGRPSMCFVGDTLVQTDHGLIRISDVVPGTCVLTLDPDTLESSYNEVLAVHVGSTDRLVVIDMGSEMIVCAAEHPFWVVGEGWVTAAALCAGKRLADLDGRAIQITEVDYQSLSEAVRVYNITVAGDRTYVVGNSGVLVHNKSF